MKTINKQNKARVFNCSYHIPIWSANRVSLDGERWFNVTEQRWKQIIKDYSISDGICHSCSRLILNPNIDQDKLREKLDKYKEDIKTERAMK